MEKNVLPRPEVVREINNFIPVELFVDRPTPSDRQNQKRMLELAGSSAMPIYAVVSTEGKLLKAVQGRKSAEEFVAFLQQGKSAATRTASR